jgi:hypothetical protein
LGIFNLMPKFRKRPVVIEAVQYRGQNVPGVCTGQCCNRDETVAHIHTLEGDLTVSEGDWVITGVKGERYACKPDIFEATYEFVE